MSLLIKTKWLWMPGIAMLVSSSVTSQFIQSNPDLTDQIGQWHSHHALPATVLESCCTYRLPENTTTDIFQLTSGKADSDPVSVADIWTRMRDGFDFPAVDPQQVRSHIDEYVKHPQLFAKILQRGEPYLFHILNRLEQNGMPAELALLPMVESSFDPFATSPVGAAGIWQFMPETADYLGLNQDGWYDGRRDIIASTEAALDYLGRLHKRFDGDWLLALAGYNAGGARVQRAIRHNRDSGKPSDFWHLALPAETRSYIPKLIALRTIIANPQDYNVTLPQLPDSGYFSTIEIQGQLELRVAARLSGTPLQELQRLNPGYDLSITPPGLTHTLLVPASVADIIRTRIALLPQDQRIQSIRYRVRLGDNLSTIAQRYRTTVSDIRRANRLDGSKIIAGDLLIIPVETHEDTIAANSHTVSM
jgi:membrane-bound lytic murein transglycosylase D